MANEKDPWFVVERSEALAGLLLTSRKDVKVRSERRTDEGVDLLVEVESDHAPSIRLFAVQVKGTVSSDRAEWMASVKHLFRTGSIFMPACAFVVNVRENKAFYAWVAEPVVLDAGAKLNFAASPHFHDLTLKTVDDIVVRVNAWYDALPAQLAVRTEAPVTPEGPMNGIKLGEYRQHHERAGRGACEEKDRTAQTTIEPVKDERVCTVSRHATETETPMMLLWKIRYLDRTDKQFKDRYVYLHTKTLDPATRAAVEFVAETKSRSTEREILKYRHLFIEGTAEGPGEPNDWGKFSTVGPSEYLEDETGREITHDEMAQILTGSPTARVIPRGAQQHDIDLMLAERKPIPLAGVSLSPDETRHMGYFVRDLQEMMNSAFMKDSPGSLSSSSGFLSPSSSPTLETAATDEEIRSFITIFRRLYMTSHRDPANFLAIVALFVRALGDHPYSKWVEGTAKQYENHLATVPDARPFVPPGTATFTTKQLIDVFLYTQYAHQPSEERQRQFGKYLTELHGKQAVLTWMFLTEIWKCALEIGNAGRLISWWFKQYCAHHSVSPDVLNSLRDDHSGLGAAEKEEDRRERLFREKVEQLATDLWEQAGRPADGPPQFLNAARDQLGRMLQG